jgi:ketosteroid isomerase-like protein
MLRDSYSHRSIFNQGHIMAAAITMLVILSASPGAAHSMRTSKNEVATEVRAVLDKQVVAWNAHDLKGFMAGYWKSPELTFFSGGTKQSGWDQTMARYIDRYSGPGKEMGVLDFSDLRIEVLGPRAAFVRGKWHLKLASGDTGGLFTLVFRKFHDGWKIIHDHTSVTT